MSRVLTSPWRARGALLSAVTYSEVLVKLSDKGLSMTQATNLLAELDFTIVPFGDAEAVAVAAIRPHTLSLEISFGDRACLSLALQHGLRLLNGDHDWAKLVKDIGCRQAYDILQSRKPRAPWGDLWGFQFSGRHAAGATAAGMAIRGWACGRQGRCSVTMLAEIWA